MKELARRVFRVSGLPGTLEAPEDIVELLSNRLGVREKAITVRSLARSLGDHENPPTTVATVMFNACLRRIDGNQDGDEWHIDPLDHNLDRRRYILDTHFRGLTPLNDSSHPQASYE
ncbi:hypothetical protein ALUC_10249S [Aspergillus luchuensis]|nr:hypothetical protein ALUC_10249S [Aspergillus luchuensis]